MRSIKSVLANQTLRHFRHSSSISMLRACFRCLILLPNFLILYFYIIMSICTCEWR
ncbi:hypothetical protein ZEAMMB73_Zm00001d050463 [Zea mays]|uniref:Uncharacterized protein n=1 Tax=Zea mays TaxID=4577 RepID=A0A1D6Q1R4_MAIZE|nr:hypothetical protein ZEAMMB73_Zm00001d050463 [Zea mays]